MTKYLKSDTSNLFLIVFVNLIIKLPLLNYLPPYFDEKAFYLEGAKSYLTSFTDPNFEHPPLSKEIIALGIKIFGDNPWGWRLPSVLFGTLGIGITYLLAKKLFQSTKVALLSGFFLTFDFLWFVHSRIAVPEIFLAVFCLIAVYFFLSYYQNQKFRYLILFGIFLGLALATKWSALFILLGVVVFLLLDGGDRGNKKDKGSLIKKIRMVTLTFLITTSAYFFSYLPYLSQSHSIYQVWERQVKIFHYHTNEAKKAANGASPPYLWPLDPIQLYYQPSSTSNQYELALANPFFFWGSLLALGYYLRSLIKKWQREMGFLGTLFLSLYVPWYFVGRYTFFYYLLTALPLLAIILAKSLIDLEKVNGRWGRKLLVLRSGFITGNALGFLMFYPLLVALPVTNLYLNIVASVFK